MSSIIEGYNYDIFISYRQKDNKHDGWVTEFVNNLKGELESTFKEEISVYFDINPHDGLLETHDVDESLKEKLKCLVFIPIISRTYCDPKSFAWEHEFKAFVEQASKDQFGLKVKLPNGNITSRVLPIRIHDLESEDVKCFEGVTGSIMRTLDFVFKTSSGVNRPLKSREDHPGDNLNKTYYQDQINKVALAIKEIVQGMKAEPAIVLKEKTKPIELLEEVKKEERKEVQEKPAELPKRKLLIGGIVLVVLLVIAVILAYPKIFKQDKLEKLRSSGEKISIAVMPFQNMTNEENKNDWQDWIQDILITSLTNSEELKVRQSQTINDYIQSKGLTNYALITPSVARTISKKLDVSIFIYGSIIKEGDRIRITSKLIDSKTEEVYKSFQKEGTADKIIPTIDSLATMVKDFLIISKLKKEVTADIQTWASTTSPEAYRYFIYGGNAFSKFEFPNAVKFYLTSLSYDSNNFWAIMSLSFAYGNQGFYDQAKEWCLKLYNKRDQMSEYFKTNITYLYSHWFETPLEEIKYARQILEFDNQAPRTYYAIGDAYFKLYQYDKAIFEFEKVFEIYNKWGSKPFWVADYTELGDAYHKFGQYKKEKKLYKKAEQDFPNDPFLIIRQAILELSEGNTKDANKYIEKYISIRKEQSWSEAQVANALGDIYSDADILDKAEEDYRKALSLEPESPARLDNLGYFLINRDLNINEGLDLVDKALKLRPDSYSYLHHKGWGLYKQGKYREALEILQKSWEIRREKAIYNHEAYLHLEAAIKADASQKNN